LWGGPTVHSKEGSVDIQWVKIRAWHALRSRDGIPHTYCGRWPQGAIQRSDDLPAERSCESCLRIIARKADA
jgi:hypothetical protein